MKTNDTEELWGPDDTVVMERQPLIEKQQQSQTAEDMREKSKETPPTT